VDRDGVSGRFAVLAPDWLLRGYRDRPAVLSNWRTGEAHSLSSVGGYVARSCDGATDFSAPFFLPAHLATLALMLEQGMAEECERGTELDARQRLRTAPNRYLRFANWAVTGCCNLRCRHCYMDAPSGRYGELSTEDAFRILDQLERANVPQVHLTGGEPLLRGDIWELIAACAERRLGVHQISTNGLLLDDEALSRLRALDVDPIIHFSFDGVGSHDSMRGLGDVEAATVRAMRSTAEAGFRVAVTSSLDAETAGGMLGTLDLLADLGTHTWHVSAPIEIGCWTGSATTLPLARQADVSEAIVRRWLALDRPFVITLCGMYGGSPDSFEPPVEPLHRCVPEELHCGALLNETVYVMPDGRIIPCPRFIDTPVQDAMPSLLDVGLSEAWEDPVLRDLVSVTKADVLAHNPACAACADFADCGAGCWAMAYAETGDLLGRDRAACELWKSGYRERLYAAAAEEYPRAGGAGSDGDLT
jgi:Fe-coproporphyrin III synthase